MFQGTKAVGLQIAVNGYGFGFGVVFGVGVLIQTGFDTRRKVNRRSRSYLVVMLRL